MATVFLQIETRELSYFGNGCCLFDDWTIAYYRGDLSIQRCLEECNNDPSCAAVDLSQPNGDGWNAKYMCHTLPGTLENLHAACDLRSCLCKHRKDQQHCFAKKKPTSKLCLTPFLGRATLYNSYIA